MGDCLIDHGATPCYAGGYGKSMRANRLTDERKSIDESRLRELTSGQNVLTPGYVNYPDSFPSLAFPVWDYFRFAVIHPQSPLKLLTSQLPGNDPCVPLSRTGGAILTYELRAAIVDRIAPRSHK
jgi:hypothetical protein